ncbi:MAG: ribosome assembly factor SBDS [Candidatus Pacearchaeota archaeon]
MTQTTARIKKAGKPFEIIVDMDAALKFKKGQSSIVDFLEMDTIFSDAKKGLKAPVSDLMEAFKTENIFEIASRIVKEGEVLLSQEHRSAEQEAKFKQVVDFLSRNAIDPKTGNPHTAERIKNALEQAHVNIKNVPIENQIKDILAQITGIIPIKFNLKKVKIVIPAIHTGKAYGVVSQYKEDETWLSNGDLEIKVVVPSGMIMNFYDKLNSVTHGSALTEEIKE